jgi:hypothetical protein
MARQPGSPNSEVLIYDTQLENYRVLPECALPLVTITDELRDEIEAGTATNSSVQSIRQLRLLARDSSPEHEGESDRRSTVFAGQASWGVGERTVHGTNELLVGTIRSKGSSG